MTDFEIIEMWRKGNSKAYIVNEKLKDFENKEKYRGVKTSLLREEAYKYVEDILLKEYKNKNMSNKS